MVKGRGGGRVCLGKGLQFYGDGVLWIVEYVISRWRMKMIYIGDLSVVFVLHVPAAELFCGGFYCFPHQSSAALCFFLPISSCPFSASMARKLGDMAAGAKLGDPAGDAITVSRFGGMFGG